MTIYTEEFMALKVALGIVRDRISDLDDTEIGQVANAIMAIANAEERQRQNNSRMARYMKERRSR